jgi:hypothetical protein
VRVSSHCAAVVAAFARAASGFSHDLASDVYHGGYIDCNFGELSKRVDIVLHRKLLFSEACLRKQHAYDALIFTSCILRHLCPSCTFIWPFSNPSYECSGKPHSFEFHS